MPRYIYISIPFFISLFADQVYNFNINFSIDATQNQCVARMVNDIDRTTLANCKMKKVVVEGVPRLGLFALVDIKENEELRYDYGCKDVPWRKVLIKQNVLSSGLF